MVLHAAFEKTIKELKQMNQHILQQVNQMQTACNDEETAHWQRIAELHKHNQVTYLTVFFYVLVMFVFWLRNCGLAVSCAMVACKNWIGFDIVYIRAVEKLQISALLTQLLQWTILTCKSWANTLLTQLVQVLVQGQSSCKSCEQLLYICIKEPGQPSLCSASFVDLHGMCLCESTWTRNTYLNFVLSFWNNIQLYINTLSPDKSPALIQVVIFHCDSAVLWGLGPH